MDHPMGTEYGPMVAKRLTGQPWVKLWHDKKCWSRSTSRLLKKSHGET